MQSGLYRDLTKATLLVQHERDGTDEWSIEPERIPFISYPHEWCFSQLKAAALLTLAVQLRALTHSMTLKDASAYNVQFRGSEPVFIDTLSFTKYQDGQPWQAYGQFVRHFLAPLLLMSYCDARLSDLLRVNLDGVPVDLASRLLPLRSWCRLGPLTHVHVHARMSPRIGRGGRMSGVALTQLVESLARTVDGLRWHVPSTPWSGYDDEGGSYSESERRHKRDAVRSFFVRYEPRGLVWDIGGNRGTYTALGRHDTRTLVCMDGDRAAVEYGYHLVVQHALPILHLVQDFANPSPSQGWAHAERASLAERGPADVVMALAVIHHLCISNNVPLPMVADWLASLTRRWVVVEWVDREDARVKGMVADRGGQVHEYTREAWEAAMGWRFERDNWWRVSPTREVQAWRLRGA
jgi:hypothetical protein